MRLPIMVYQKCHNSLNKTWALYLLISLGQIF